MHRQTEIILYFDCPIPVFYPRLNRIYVDIMNGKNLSSIQVANMDIIFWSVCSPKIMVKGVDGGGGVSQPAMLQYMKIWCNIQVIIYLLSLLVSLLKSYSFSSVYENLFIKLTRGSSAAFNIHSSRWSSYHANQSQKNSTAPFIQSSAKWRQILSSLIWYRPSVSYFNR